MQGGSDGNRRHGGHRNKTPQSSRPSDCLPPASTGSLASFAREDRKESVLQIDSADCGRGGLLLFARINHDGVSARHHPRQNGGITTIRSRTATLPPYLFSSSTAVCCFLLAISAARSGESRCCWFRSNWWWTKTADSSAVYLFDHCGVVSVRTREKHPQEIQPSICHQQETC